ncbi:MAG: hypothetical protein M3437_16355 [Chloroflexota bacterium]|nr:hypothetical protein [Chloroflexota bacterium]MDQ5864819.1 hypothetical protein [Chloroflexota bacterium]
MKETHTSSEDQGEQDGPERYEIRIKGHLDDRWAAWFGGMTLTREESGDTLLSGQVVEQAALYGLLRKVRNLGIPLISVTLVRPTEATVKHAEA